MATVIDNDTADVILRLQLQDIADLQASAKHKEPAGTIVDSVVAWEAQKTELQDARQHYADRKLAASIASAVRSDGNLLATIAQVEAESARDRQMALDMSGERAQPRRSTAPAKPATPETEDTIDPELMAKLTALHMSEQDGFELLSSIDAEDAAESSSAAQRRIRTTRPEGDCVICLDRYKFYDLLTVPCGHDCCRNCLDELFRSATVDETLFPPRCCSQPIPLKDARLFITIETCQLFETKQVELSTPNRTYCYVPTCSAFIPPAQIDAAIATCPQCTRRTCTDCKAQAHTGDCRADEAFQQLIDVAVAQGWQRCPRCFAIVELNTGCYHITCRCRAGFCYLCAAPWKTCRCPQWDERRLLARAAAIVDRERYRFLDRRHEGLDDGHLPNNATARAVAVAEVARQLERDHDCPHEYWEKRDGRFDCEECEDTLHKFIFVCRQCHVMACWRCRTNRL